MCWPDEGVGGGQTSGAAGQHERRSLGRIPRVGIGFLVQEVGGGFVGAVLTGVMQRRLSFGVDGVDFDVFIFVDEKSDDVAETFGGGVVQRRRAVTIR